MYIARWESANTAAKEETFIHFQCPPFYLSSLLTTTGRREKRSRKNKLSRTPVDLSRKRKSKRMTYSHK